MSWNIYFQAFTVRTWRKRLSNLNTFLTPHIYWGIHITICVNYNQHNRSAAQKNPVNKICLLLVFSVPTERAAIATGNDLRGLGICHQQAFSRNSGNGISAKYAILRKIALLASSFRNLAKNSTLILFGQPPIMYSEYFVGGLLCLNI